MFFELIRSAKALRSIGRNILSDGCDKNLIDKKEPVEYQTNAVLA